MLSLVSTNISTDSGENFKDPGGELVLDQACKYHHIPGNLQNLIHDLGIALLYLVAGVTQHLTLVATSCDCPN